MVFLQHFHDGFRWLVVLVGIISLVKSAIGLIGNGPWTALDRRLLGIFNGVLGIQFLLGLILITMKGITVYGGDMMFWRKPLEHGTTMIIALVIAGITLGRTKKATTDRSKFTISLVGLAVTALLIYVGVMSVNGWG